MFSFRIFFTINFCLIEMTLFINLFIAVAVFFLFMSQYIYIFIHHMISTKRLTVRDFNNAIEFATAFMHNTSKHKPISKYMYFALSCISSFSFFFFFDLNVCYNLHSFHLENCMNRIFLYL